MIENIFYRSAVIIVLACYVYTYYKTQKNNRETLELLKRKDEVREK